MSATTEPPVWDARAAYDVGQLILEYLVAHPAPPGAHYPGDLRNWAERLTAMGRRNQGLPAPRLARLRPRHRGSR